MKFSNNGDQTDNQAKEDGNDKNSDSTLPCELFRISPAAYA